MFFSSELGSIVESPSIETLGSSYLIFFFTFLVHSQHGSDSFYRFSSFSLLPSIIFKLILNSNHHNLIISVCNSIYIRFFFSHDWCQRFRLVRVYYVYFLPFATKSAFKISTAQNPILFYLFSYFFLI